MEETQVTQTAPTADYSHSDGLKKAGMIVALWVAGKATAYITASPLLTLVNKVYPMTPEQIDTYVTGAVLMGLAYGHHYLRKKYPQLP